MSGEDRRHIKGRVFIFLLVIAAATAGVRAMSILSGEADPSLRAAIEEGLNSGRITTTVQQASRMEKVKEQESGRMASRMVTVAGEKPIIKSIRTTKRIFDFSTEKQDVIAEVIYTIGGQERIEYYRFERDTVSKGWRVTGTATKNSFYMHLL